MSKNRVVVKINGAEYVLAGEEAENYLFSIASYVDKKIKEILSSNAKHSNTSAAVLAAVTVADELFKERKENEYLKKKVDEPEDRFEKLTQEYNALKEKYNEINEQYSKYKEGYESSISDSENLKNECSAIQDEYNKENDSYERLLKENAFLKEENAKLEKEVGIIRDETAGLKDKLLENQIELVSVKKDFKDYKDTQSRK